MPLILSAFRAMQADLLEFQISAASAGVKFCTLQGEMPIPETLEEGFMSTVVAAQNCKEEIDEDQSKQFLVYRGKKMIAGWPEKIREAQAVTHYEIDGKRLGRVRYGEEADDWGADRNPCHDCGVIKGELHVVSCDVERCPRCAGQAIDCDCEKTEIRT